MLGRCVCAFRGRRGIRAWELMVQGKPLYERDGRPKLGDDGKPMYTDWYLSDLDVRPITEPSLLHVFMLAVHQLFRVSVPPPRAAAAVTCAPRRRS